MPVPSSALTTQHTASYRSYCTLQLPELDFLGRGLWPVQGRNQLSQTNFGPKKFWHINHHKSSSEGTIYFGYMSSVKCLKKPVCNHSVFLLFLWWFTQCLNLMLIFKDNCLILSNWKRSDMHSAQCTAELASILSSDGRMKLIVRILVCN